jgi:hypothetical protein
VTISVVIPTIPGREAHLERCVNAYTERSHAEIELIVIPGRPTCGIAWNDGAAKAGGEYLHLTADDLEPLEGWDDAALETLRACKIPAPLILTPKGGIESAGGWWDRVPVDWAPTTNTCVVPFCRRRDWEANIGPSLECHYYTDDWFTDQCRRAGCEVVVRLPYRFMHHWASEGRGDEPAKLERDRLIYEEATRRCG